jgi:hypothetical protein
MWSPHALDPYGVLALLAVRDAATGELDAIRTKVHGKDARSRSQWRVVRREKEIVMAP